MALTIATIPLSMLMSPLEECRGRVEQALAAIGTEASKDPRREMKLHAALGCIPERAASRTASRWLQMRCVLRANRSSLDDVRVPALQRRASPVQDDPDPVQAEDPHRKAGCPVLGAACCDQLRPVAARSRASADGKALLRPVYDRFTEGFDTGGLKAEKGLIDGRAFASRRFVCLLRCRRCNVEGAVPTSLT